MAADERGLEHRRGKEIDRVLREIAAPQRTLARPEPRKRRTVVGNLARRGSEEAGERCDERRLPGAVRADDRPAFAGADVEIESGDERAPPDREREAAACETRRGSAHDRPRDSNARNTGTPTSAVITPTGSCTGATTVRASVSASDEQRAARQPRTPATTRAGRCR